MTTFYHPVDTDLYDFFEYRNAAGGVTGKVQADFTIQLASRSSGNVSTTGITITEVDAANNPGVYRIFVPSTAFVATLGDYELSVFDTSSPANAWGATYKVANSNTAPSSLATFTATSGNGRVTYGSSPISGATVDVRNLSGVLLTRVVTDGNGNWGPVFLNENANFYVQANGYTQGTGTIGVTGGIATGPGSDIALTASGAAASLTASSLWAYARRMARDRVGARSDEVIRQAVNDAISKLARDLHSQWWHRQKDITLRGAYNTGLISITAGTRTVTLSGGVFPSYAADDGTRIEIGNRLYEIETRDSDTQVTLAVDLDGESVVSGEYNLISVSSQLPENMYQLMDVIYGQDWVWGNDPSSFLEVIEHQRFYQRTQDRAYLWAVAHGRIHVWPAASNDVQVSLAYYAKPEALINSSDVADVDPIHLDLLYRGIDHQIAIRFGDTEGEMSPAATLRLYQDLIKGSESFDRNHSRKESPLGSRSRRNGLLRGLRVPGS